MSDLTLELGLELKLELYEALLSVADSLMESKRGVLMTLHCAAVGAGALLVSESVGL